jgi:hypothetical protein
MTAQGHNLYKEEEDGTSLSSACTPSYVVTGPSGLRFVFPSYHSYAPGLAEVRPGLLRALEEHFFHHFRISLSAFLLYRISTPVAHLNSQGKLKVRPPSPPTHNGQ